MVSVTEQILDQVANLIEGGSGPLGAVTGPTFTVVWITALNPEPMIGFPVDAYLVSLSSNQATNVIFISKNGRVSVANPGITGIGGDLLAMFVPNGTATTPWYGRARVDKGSTLWAGGASAGFEAVLTFEMIPEDTGVRQPPVIPPHRDRRRRRG